MIVIHVYKSALREALALPTEHIVRDDLHDIIKNMADGYEPMTHGEFIEYGIMNIITRENA